MHLRPLRRERNNNILPLSKARKRWTLSYHISRKTQTPQTTATFAAARNGKLL
ncbi:MAG: hypothetical protein LBJ67_04105 [Planctomycetaceae bacterium]|nr:hypothetical protein [Planctomycetaceae bacterium]